MICPNCNVEYREGFKECSDCKVDLIAKKVEKEEGRTCSSKAISLIKYGIGLLFLSMIEIVVAIIAYEFYWVYRLNNGGVNGSVIENVHPVIWIIFGLQIIISSMVIVWGANINEKD